MRKFVLFFSFLISALCFLSSVFCFPVHANNISISNASFGTQDTSEDTLEVQFDISWENSWRDATNYDAVWVFIKYSTDGGATWSHATLNTNGGGVNPTGFSRGTTTVGGVSKNIDIVVPADNKGGFVQISSSDTGSGTLSATSVKFVWNYGTDISSSTKDSLVALSTIKVMAIEMVYVPSGSFDIGDGNGTSESGSAFHVADNTKVTIGTTLVGSIKVDENIFDDDQIELTGIGIDGDGGIDSNNDGVIDNANFPTGYNAFYIMKYDVSQGQYKDFLNTLTRTQQQTRVASTITTDTITNVYVLSNPDPEDPNPTTLKFRNGIRCPASGNGTTAAIAFGCDLNGNATFNESNDGQWISCNYLSWMDLAAYADWAGLRPFTELEFEKAGRGTESAVSGEYAWGSTAISQVAGITNGGATNEVASESGNGLCAYGNQASVQGPLRCGFAATAGTTRSQAAASYYGIMELSGNNWEKAVTVGSSTGRSFTGSNGDGSLSTNGNANNSDWPGYALGEITAMTGAGFRGGDWHDDVEFTRVSDRNFAAYVFSDRRNGYGARCCRIYP